MQRNLFAILLAMSGVGIILASCALGAFALLQSEESDNDEDPIIQVNPSITPPDFKLPSLPPIERPSESGGEVATPQPSPTQVDLAAELAALIGVSNVRVIEVTPYERGISVLLEIDVLRGYVSEETADAVREVAFPVLGEDQQIDFSVILWDRVNAAQNYTWDAQSQGWHVQQLVSNPG
jgi:hypothetical protein